jgi:exopolysaccharide production protein ExoZ
MNRLFNLDYLRGLTAFGIMIYHYLTWSFGEFGADTFMGRVGVYGVSIFYVLSGLTLFYVYNNKMSLTFEDIISFFKKRIFRIFPMIWLVTLASIALSMKTPDFFNLFLNLSGLFGFFKWDTYFSPGVWSIGNELVFYVFFPFFLILSKSFKYLFVLLCSIILFLFLYFAFFKLSAQTPLSEQWSDYINPLNQVFLFLGGFLLGLFFNTLKVNNVFSIALLIFSVLIFNFYPANGNTIVLVTGLNRLIFTVLSFSICFSFYKLSLKFPFFIHKPLTILGESSYSVYLLHPIVFKVVEFISKKIFNIPDNFLVIFSIIITLGISYFTYEYFEKFFINFGKRNFFKKS